MTRAMSKRRQAQHAQERRARWHARLRLGGLLLSVVLLVGALGYGLLRLLDTQSLPIRNVQIEGHLKHLQTDELKAAIAPYGQGNFFKIDIDGLQTSLQKLAWVKTASVRRVWPDTLRVRVTEQVPFAVWNGEQLMNAQGEVFDARPADVAESLPRFEGPEGYAPQIIQRRRQFDTLLSELQLHSTQISVSERRAWRVLLNNGVELKLGREQLQQRLQRFTRVYARSLAPHSQRVARVDLRYTNGFAVAWHESDCGQGQNDAQCVGGAS